MDTGRGVLHTVVSWGVLGEGQQGVGRWGGIMTGEIPDIGDGRMKAANHLTMYIPM